MRPRTLLIVILLLFPLVAPQARTTTNSAPASLCGQAISVAERSARLPPQLLGTIAIIESGRQNGVGSVQPWPWTINAEGIGAFFDTKEQAIEAVQALQARGVRSIDVGCMQINLLHHADAFKSLDEAFEPRSNVIYAARFLNLLFNQTGAWPKAAAAYHSQTPEIGLDYGHRVMSLWPLAARFMERAVPEASQLYTAELAHRLAQDAADRETLLANRIVPTAFPEPRKANPKKPAIAVTSARPIEANVALFMPTRATPRETKRPKPDRLVWTDQPARERPWTSN